MADQNNPQQPIVPPDYYQEFIKNIEAVAINTKQLTTLLPKEFAKLGQNLHDVYQNAGPSRPPQWSMSSGGAFSGTSGLSTLTGTDDASTRAQLQAHANAQAQARGLSRPGPPMDPTEAQVEGMSQTGTRVSPRWQDRVQLGGIGNVLTIPRYPGAEPNAADLLNYLGTISANLAHKRQQTLNKRGEVRQQSILQSAATNKLISLDENGDPIGDLPPDIQAQYDKAAAPETSLGKVSDLFASGESAYAQGRYIKGILHKIGRPLGSLRDLGFQTGAQGGTPGPLGIRAPWDPTVIAGIKQRASQVGMSFGGNAVTPPQASTIFQNLYERGWMQEGDPSVKHMRTGAAEMMRNNPYIASMPQYYDMMDKATRQGAASIEHFNEVMKAIPDSATAAHVSIAQTMADMDQLGQFNKGQGGTYVGGMHNAVAWQNLTGLPANVMGTLMQNPMVTGQTFMRTGLMPWEQGLASPYQRMGGILGATDMLGKMIATPGNKNYKDSIGLTQTISGQDQKEALMSHFLGVDKATVHTMLTNKEGWKAGATIGQSTQDYQTTVQNLIRSGKTTEAQRVLLGAPWSNLQHQLSTSVDAQGHKVFEDWGTYDKLRKGIDGSHGLDRTKAHQIAQQTALYNIAHAGDADILKGMGKGFLRDESFKGRSSSQMVQDALKSGKLSAGTLAKVAQDRAKKVSDYQTENTRKFGSSGQNPAGPKLQIELGPAAKKMFHLQDPNSNQKANQNAGAVDVNTNSWAGGPTPSPAPNLDTASGGGGAYNYGSQYDTGGY